MVPQAGEWTIPAPVRALLWWPFVAFVLAAVAPAIAYWSVPAAGALLAATGSLVAAVGRRRPARGSRGRAVSPRAGIRSRDAGPGCPGTQQSSA